MAGSIQAAMEEAKLRKLSTRSLIDSSFPTQGTEQKAHEGSQSTAPDKGGIWNPDMSPPIFGKDKFP